MKIAFTSLMISLLLATASGSAFAQGVPNHPGWKLERVEKEPEESGVIEYADFFGLYPNDTRPPITIDGNTANRILSGQLSPESVYFDRTAGAVAAAAKAKSESSGGGAVGWQVAESTYVPLGTNGAAKGMNATNSSLLLGHAAMANGGGTANTSGGAAAAALMNAQGGNSAAAAAAMAAAQGGATGEITLGNTGSAPGSFSSGLAGGARAPASAANGGTSGSGSDPAYGSGNQTYSQMIDAAMSNASTSLCGRMGAYAAAGQCK